MAHNLLLTCLYKYRVSLADELLLELAIELLALVNYAKSFVFCMSFRCVCGIRERNPTSTKGRSRWKSSSENYLLIAEVRVRVRVMVRVRVRVRVMVRVRVRESKPIFHENYFWWMSNCVFRGILCLM